MSNMTARAVKGGTTLLVCSLLGLLAFFISGSLASIMLLLWNNYIVAAMAAGSIGCLLLCLFLNLKGKTARMAIAGALGIPVGIAASFGIVEGAGAILLIPDSFAQTGIPDVIAICIMGMIFGAVLGGLGFDKKAILLFSPVCGLLCIPFGFLVVAMNKGFLSDSLPVRVFEPIGRLDLNLLAILLGMGLGSGLSVGLSQRRK